MNKFSAQRTYSRMAEFVKDSGVSDERHITRAIADATGVSFYAVSKWKEGTTKSVQSRYISEFCEKYDANPDYITTGTLPKRRDTYSPGFEEVSELYPLASKEVQAMIRDTLRAHVGSKKET